MNRIKFSKWLIFSVLLFLFGLNLACSQESETASNSSKNISHSVKEEELHPLSIPMLRKRSYFAENLRLLKIVPAQKGLYAQEFSYLSEGNLNFGLLERPAQTAPDSGWPVIIIAHGHIPPQQYSTTKHYRLVSQHYAKSGFLVLKPDYRGHGRSESLAEDSPSRTIDYSIDVLNLLYSLDLFKDVDISNVFIYGHSMGGEVAMRILTVSNKIKGATLWAAVTPDFPENILHYRRKHSPERFNNLKKKIDVEFSQDQLKQITPNNYLDAIKVPIIIHHGTADNSVPFEWSVDFRKKLDNKNVNYEFHAYPGGDHNISHKFYTVLNIDIDFFRKLM